MKNLTTKWKLILLLIIINFNLNSQSLTLSSSFGTDNQTVCFNTAILNIDYVVSDGATDASITSGLLPNGVSGVFSGGIFTISGTATNIGIFQFTITTIGGANSPISLDGSITVNPTPAMTVTVDNMTICEGDSAVLTPSGPFYDFSYSGNPNFYYLMGSSFTVAPSATTTYDISGTDANGCFASTSVTISVNSLPANSLQSNSPVCEGGTVIISGQFNNNMTTFVWQGPNNSTFMSSTINLSNATSNDAGTYILTTSLNGCVSVDSIDLVINSPITPVFTQIAPICVNSSVPILPIVSTNSIIGVWSPVGIDVSIADTATCYFTPNAGECATTTSLDIIVNPLPTTFAGADTTICYGESISLNVAGNLINNWMYASTNYSNGSSIVPLVGASIITLTTTDNNGCVGSDTMLLIVLPTTPITVLSNPVVCAPNTIDITDSTLIEPNLGLISYWTDSTCTMPLTNPATISSSGIYYLQSISLQGCASVAPITATIDSICPGLIGNVIPTSVSADGQCDGSAIVNIISGASPFSYSYSNGSTLSSAVDLCAGFQSVTVTDSYGDSLVINFVIPTPSNTTSTNNYFDSTLVDSVYNPAVTNCIINYFAVDSAYISSFNILPNDSVYVTWSVFYGDSSVIVNDTYGLDSVAGIYLLSLQIYCPNKSIGQFLVAYDQIYYNPEMAGIEEIKQNNLLIYPNPFNNQLTISLENDQESEVSIYDISGKELFFKKFNEKLIQIDTQSLSAGQYIVMVKNDSSVISRLVSK